MSALIGLIDQKIVETETISWDTNKIGGLPIWMESDTSSLAIPTCMGCGKTTALVSQLYCPLGGSSYHRCVYLFVCPGKCSKQPNGWRVFRAMKHDESYMQDIQVNKGISQLKGHNDLWLDEQDDWGEGSDDWGEGSCTSDQWEIPGSAQLDPSSTCGVSHNAKTTLKSHSSHVLESEFSRELAASDNPIQQNADSLAQISDADVQTQRRDVTFTGDDPHVSPSVSHTETALIASGGSGDGEEPQILEEEIGLADSERWNAMASILNTKHDQNTALASSAGSNTDTESSIVFKPYYLCVVDEPADQVEISDHVMDLIKSYERSEGKQLDMLMSERPKSGKSKGGSAEAYEKTELKHGDKIFHKFLKRLQRCPQQCIRYERGGEPLLVSRLQGLSVPSCPYCGGEKVFEFQLLPPLIPWLRTSDDTLSEVEFGTVLVFTCKNNCWPADHDPNDPLEEFISLQADPDHHLYR